MQAAINTFQKNLFLLLLYVSGFSGYLADLAGMNRTALYALFDGLMIVLGWLSLSYTRSTLAYLLLLIVACIIINFSYSPISVYASLNGVREIVIILAIVMFYNKVFTDGNEDLVEEYIQIFRNYAILFLVMQIPAAFAQYVQFGPGDYVGGTFGYLGSGVLTMTVICLLYFLHLFSMNIAVNILLYITLIPLFLNETKISFILIPLTMLFIRFKMHPKNIIVAVSLAVLFFLVFNHFYEASYLDFDNSAAGIFTGDFLNDYLMADIYTYEDIPRFTKIILAWNLLSQELNTFLFGFEYGMFKGGNVLEISQFSLTYQWMLSGTRPYLFFLMMQGGMLLVVGFLWLMLHINNYFRNTNKYAVFLFLMLLLMLSYNDALRNQNFITVYMFLVYYANSKFYLKSPVT